MTAETLRSAPVRSVPGARSSEASTPARRGALLLYGALALVLLGLGLATAAYTVLEVFRLHVVLPFGDEWQLTYAMERVRDGTYALSSLADQYNEHRILVPRLFFFVDTFAFGASERFDITATFLFQAINAGVLIACGTRQATSRPTKAALAGFVLLALFSLAQADNFTIGFQLQFTGVFAFANLAMLPFRSGLCGLATGEAKARPGAWRRLAAAWTLCAVSAYTMANGVLAGPTLIVLALLLRAPRRVVLATAAVSVVLAAVYFHGLRQMGLGLSVSAALADPLAYPRFLGALLGDALGMNVRIPHAADPFLVPELFGLLGLAGMAAASVVVARDRDPAADGTVLLGIMGFAVASGCATTYGRVGVGLDQAFEQRYVEISVLFWSALVLFWAPHVGRPASIVLRFAGRAALAATVAVLVAALGIAEVRAPHEMIAQTARYRLFRDALLSGFLDPVAGRYEIWPPAELARPVSILKAGRLSLFAGPEAEERGRPVDAVGETAPASACAGSVSAEADPALGAGGVRVTGTAWDAGRDGPVARILTVGPDGLVSGFGSPDRPVGRMHGWTGYATAAAGSPVSAYAVLADGRLCGLGSAEVTAR